MKRKQQFAVLFAGLATFVGDALAIVGRPLTPVSVAGTSRRVARRTTRRNVAMYSGAAAAATVAALPPGCYAGQPCGGVVYVPHYEGTQVVYVVQEP